MGWVSLPSDVHVDELSHHGVKNQKWGRRRWQNPDGSYTQAGRVHYGIGLFKKKSKMSKDAKLRAKERIRAKNEAARQEAYEAEARRALAETEAERAKTALREAKKQNSLAYKLGAKAVSAASDKMSEYKAEKESRKPLSKNAKRYIDAIQSGKKRKIKKYAAKLNNDEYRKAIERVNMKYELERAADDAKIAKGKQIVAKLTNTADTMAAGANIWNAAAGVVSAFSGKNVPKISTKYEDPIDRLKKREELLAKQHETEQKMETARSQREIANQNKYKAEAERTKSEKERYNWEEELTKRETEKAEKAKQDRVDKIMARLSKDVVLKSPSGSPKHFSKDPSQIKEVMDKVGIINVKKKIPKSFNVNLGDNRPVPMPDIKVQKKGKDKAFEILNMSTADYARFLTANKNGYKYGEVDVSKLPKEQQQMFFAMLNSTGYKF